MTVKPESLGILRHHAGKPGEHDAVKADFRELLIAEFDVPRAEVHLETRIEVRRRMTIRQRADAEFDSRYMSKEDSDIFLTKPEGQGYSFLMIRIRSLQPPAAQRARLLQGPRSAAAGPAVSCNRRVLAARGEKIFYSNRS